MGLTSKIFVFLIQGIAHRDSPTKKGRFGSSGAYNVVETGTLFPKACFVTVTWTGTGLESCSLSLTPIFRIKWLALPKTGCLKDGLNQHDDPDESHVGTDVM